MDERVRKLCEQASPDVAILGDSQTPESQLRETERESVQESQEGFRETETQDSQEPNVLGIFCRRRGPFAAKDDAFAGEEESQFSLLGANEAGPDHVCSPAQFVALPRPSLSDAEPDDVLFSPLQVADPDATDTEAEATDLFG